MKTSTLVVGSGAYVAIKIKSLKAVQRIFIMEDPSVIDWPTTDYLLKMPAESDGEIRKLAGTGYKPEGFGRHYEFDSIVGYIKTVTGTTTFQLTEEP